MAPDNQSIGIVGLGRLGFSITRQLRAAGYRVVGFDVSPPAAERVVELGATIAASPREAAEQSEATLVVVGTDEQVLTACSEQQDGLLAGAAPGHAVLVCSTVAPATVQEVARRARRLGVETLDAPLARGEQGVDAGEALALVGAERETFERWQEILRVFCSDVKYLGEVGAGQVGKMTNNLLLWATIAANVEAFRLAQGFGLDLEALRQGLLAGSGSNWALGTWDRPRAMPWAADDLALVLESAAELEVDVPISNVVREVIASLRADKADWEAGTRNVSLAQYVAETGPGDPRASTPSQDQGDPP